MFFLLPILISTFPNIHSASGQIDSWINFKAVLDQIDMKLIREHVEALTSFPNESEPSRFTGYPGFFMAADYIKSKLVEYGYTPEEENFSVTVPVDKGAEIVVLKDGEVPVETIKAYPLIPNTVNPSVTPKEGISGKLVYGGTGKLSELSGKDLEDSIVLLEYNSRWYWKNAVMLGAKAIIFIEPDITTQVESLGKSMGVPAPIPRVYVNKEDGLWLRKLATRSNGEPVKILLKSRMSWENLIVPNIIATKEGSEKPLENIIVAAHYDSYSPVPSIAPGTTEAIDVAAVLEMARIFSNSSFAPKRTLKFVFFGGHGQALAGAREFVDAHFNEIGFMIKMMVCLDLSYDSPYLGIYAKGSTYEYRTSVEGRRFPWVNDRIISTYVPEMRRQIGKDYKVLSAMFPIEPISDPNPMFFDAEPYTLAGGIGVTFHTTNALRERERTPKDDPEIVNYKMLQPQIETVVGCVYGFSQEEILSVSSSPQRIASDEGFAIIEGTVGLYNLTTAWYDPFEHEDSIVHIQWPLYIPPTQVQFAPSGKGGMGVREPPTFDVYVKPGPDGRFVFKGVKPYTAVRVEAYVVDDEDSRVLYATDFGVYGLGKGYPFPQPTADNPGGAYVWISDATTVIWRPVFKCSSIVFFEVVDPRTSSVISVSIHNYNFYAHSWNLQHCEDVKGTDAMVFIPPNEPSEFMMYLGTTGDRLAVLANISQEYPQGYGYTLQPGEILLLRYSPYVFAQQLLRLTGSRADLMTAYHVSSAQIEMYYPKAKEKLKIAEEAFQNKEWDVMMAYSMAAWAYGLSAYRATMSLLYDVITTVIFFLLLLIPFSLLLQKLLSPHTIGLKRVSEFVLILLVSLGVLYILHPGFHIAFNVFMVAIASGVSVLSFAALLVLISGASTATKVLQMKALGAHRAESAGAAGALLAFSVGIENMRKRKFRTSLTLISLLTLSIGLIVLTSATFYTVILPAENPGKTPYTGLLIRDAEWNPMSEEMARILEGLFKGEAQVSERTWIVEPYGIRLKKDAVADGALGLTPQEADFLGLDKTLIKGRWFVHPYERSAIVSEVLMDQMGTEVGDKINWLGLNLTIVGVYSVEAWSSAVDLDQSYLAPITWAEQYPHPLPPDKLLIVPYNLLMEEFNYFPYTVALKFKSSANIPDIAPELTLQMQRIGVYSGLEGRVTYYNPLSLYGISGMEFLIAPLAISAFTVLNVMLASVYERIREIHIFSSLGISPKGIGFMFLAESVLYGIISAIAGYLISTAIMSALSAMNLNLTGMPLNYASTFVIAVVGLITSTAIISTLYPASKASRLVTPSLKRKWEISTSPIGNNWLIPLPFVMNIQEAGGAILFLGEYAMASTATYGSFAVQAETIRYEADSNSATVKFDVRLAPFDMNLFQNVEISAVKVDKDKMRFSLNLHRVSGHIQQWTLANYRFADAIRKQLLLWRILKPDQKKTYIAKAQEMFGGKLY